VRERARFCLACAAPLRTVHDDGRRRRRCPRCGWTFYDNPVLASCAVIRRRGRVLLARRARPPYAGLWDLPGGFIEAGEAPEVALGRELREELGARVRRARLVVFEPDHYGPGGFPTLAAVYLVALAPGALRCSDDVAEARWFAEDAIPYRRVAFASMRRALRVCLRLSRR
jgi:ADP-ribose pyrophosphatase YjhB (NUDIX family)